MLALFLLFLLVLPASAGQYTDSCGMVWTDTCIPFERNNETAYNEELAASWASIAANITEECPDFSTMSWTDAFAASSAYMAERYAFTEWRGIDWEELSLTYAPKIADAEKRDDSAAYYRALREFSAAIPDGHVMVLSRDDFGAKYADVGGGYGLAVGRLDSGKVIVTYVANGSAAEKAGVRFGDEVVAWNGRPIGEAINATPIIWAPIKPSTEEGAFLQRQRFLTRAPVGTAATVGLAGRPGPVTLTAADDGYDTLTRTSTFLGRQVNDVGAATLPELRAMVSNETVTYRTLPGGYAYIAVYEEAYGVYQPFRAAVKDAIARDVPGIVIDLRYNGGGDDNLASAYGGWFVNSTVFYEYGTFYDPGTGTFPILWEAWTQPRPDRYRGPVALLVSPYTLSSGEGLPMVFTRSGTGAIVSWYGTNGAFGMEDIGPKLPLGIVLLFPTGASLDENGTVQVDSNASLIGGIAPTVRVPIDEDTVARSMAGEDVQLSYAVAWLEEQAASGSAQASAAAPTQKAASGLFLPLAAVAIFAVYLGRR
ncbi:S41 family peptidase [Methanoculleus frigidifontis]|nr:S41 family peptidase [Methanoculleus sp. FWC-SCC1]